MLPGIQETFSTVPIWYSYRIHPTPPQIDPSIEFFWVHSDVKKSLESTQSLTRISRFMSDSSEHELATTFPSSTSSPSAKISGPETLLTGLIASWESQEMGWRIELFLISPASRPLITSGCRTSSLLDASVDTRMESSRSWLSVGLG